MLQLLTKMARKDTIKVETSIEDLLKGGAKIWAYF